MTRVSLIKGDGVGPEIADSVVSIFSAAGADITWEICDQGSGEERFANMVNGIKDTLVGLKAPLTTPVGEGFKSLNVRLRDELDLYSCVRPVKSIEGLSRFEDVDLIIIRENTEGLYIGEEHSHKLTTGGEAAFAVRRITDSATARIVGSAISVANVYGKNKITCAHKANILKQTDGLFLRTFYKCAEYDDGNHIFNDLIIDNCSMQLVTNPSQFDVIVTANLYGDILSDLAAGLVGGLGVAGGANIGDEMAVFEAVHGTAPDIAGKGIANPTALLESALMMLDYLNQKEVAEKIREVKLEALSKPETRTGDLGGNLNTAEFTEHIIKRL